MTIVHLFDKTLNFNNKISKDCFTQHKFMTNKGEVIDLTKKHFIEYSNYLIETNIYKLDHTVSFNKKQHGFDGSQIWYNIQLDQNEWRTVAITIPNGYNNQDSDGKFLINFDFTTGYNTGFNQPFKIKNNPIHSPLDPLYGYKSQNSSIKKSYLGGMELLVDGANVWKDKYPIKGPLDIFTNLLKNNIAIIHLTQSSSDTIAYGEGICNATCKNINGINSYDKILFHQHSNKTILNINQYNRSCPSKKCWTHEDTSCTVFSNCNNADDLFWNIISDNNSNDLSWSNDQHYIKKIMYLLRKSPSTLNLEQLDISQGGVFGWSVGAQAVSRYMNEFIKIDNSNIWPTPKFGVIGAGGSLHCYEGSMGTYWNDSFRKDTISGDVLKLGQCPYFPTLSPKDTSKNKKAYLEPTYDNNIKLYKYHPPVFGFQSEEDHFADRYAVISYINSLKFHTKHINPKIYNDSSYIIAKGIQKKTHGMANQEQIDAVLQFMNQQYN